jgi:uncharacterized protein YerC
MGKKKEKEGFPAVGEYSSRKEWERDCWEELQKSPELLKLLVTPYERRNLVLRAAVIDRIKSGKSYREIEEELWLSSQTISVIKKAIKRSGYISYWERGKTERKKRCTALRFRKQKKGREVGPSAQNTELSTSRS